MLTTRKFECPSFEIAAYIDGELDAARELEIESHFAGCPQCNNELTSQKQFLCGLNASLKNESEIELPANFTQLVVANAESTVSGLRRPGEQFNAVFICVALGLFVLFALGAEPTRILHGVPVVFDKASAVGGFFTHIIYSFFLGIAIVFRSVAAQFTVEVATTIPMLLFGFSLMYFSRRVLRLGRA